VAEHGLESEFAAAEQSPGLLLWRVTNAWQAAQRAALAPFGLTHVQFVLLASLVWLHGAEPVTQSALAAHSRTDRMMTSQVLRALEGKGLLVRPAHPTDARARALAPTEAGVRLANEANAAVEATDAAFFARLGADVPVLARMLGALAADRQERPGMQEPDVCVAEDGGREIP
jgi:MarR family transcriptional regulator, organic hydroperoxide resistance regulator